MSHTPGPWKVDEDGFVWGYLPGSHMKEPRFLIAQVRGWGYMQYMQGGEQIHAANARLIAAAPELFEACTLAMDVMNNEDATGLDLYECRLILTRACTKAMGVPALEFVEQELAFVERERAKMGGKSA